VELHQQYVGKIIKFGLRSYLFQAVLIGTESNYTLMRLRTHMM